MTQRSLLAEQGASLHLASAERDGLLRENDKIIAHYKKVGVGGCCGVLDAREVQDHCALQMV